MEGGHIDLDVVTLEEPTHSEMGSLSRLSFLLLSPLRVLGTACVYVVSELSVYIVVVFGSAFLP